MLRKTLSALSVTVAIALSIGVAFAQGTTTIDNLPAATAPLSGNESVPIWQNFHTRKATPLQLSAILAQVTAPANPFQFQLWEDTSANPAKLKQFDGTQWVVIALLDTSAHLSGVMNPSALPGGVVATAAQANKYVSAINTDGTVTLAQPQCSNLSDVGNICPKSTGKSVGDPGGGVIESLFNAQAVTGTNRIFTCADMQKLTRRSNSGSVMADNFPDATATTCLTHGAWAVVENIDATAVDVVTAGIGTAFGTSGAATDTIEPGRFVIYAYDLSVPAAPRWRRIFNSSAGAFFDATGSNVSGDLVSLASAYGKVHDSGVLASQVVTSSAGLTNGRIVMGTTNAQGVTSLSSAGSTVTVLHGNASGNPSWGAVALPTDVSGLLPLASGGLNNSITASAGGILWSDASKINVLGGTATAGQILQSGASATPAWSPSTYPGTAGAAGHVPRSNATNYVDSSLAASDLSNGVSGTPGSNIILAGGSPAFTGTPVLAAATATSINGLHFSGSGTINAASGKTGTFSNTITLTGTDGASVNVGTGGSMATVTSGTWTPVFLGSTTNPTCTYDNQDGAYTQLVNGAVLFTLTIGTSACSSVGAGTLTILLPIASASSHSPGGGVAATGWATLPASWRLQASAGAFILLGSTGSTILCSALNTGSGSNRVFVSGIYFP